MIILLGRNTRFVILVGVLLLVVLAMACTNDDAPRSQFTPLPTDEKESSDTTSGTTSELTNTTEPDPISDLVSNPNNSTEVTEKNLSQPLQPVIRLHYDGQDYDGVQGSFCWPVEQGVSLCADEGPFPWQDLDLHAIPVTIGDSIIVEIVADDRPQKLLAAISEKDSDTDPQFIELDPGLKSPLAIDLPAGVYNIRISGHWEVGAQAYKFRLNIGSTPAPPPPSPTAATTATATPTPVPTFAPVSTPTAVAGATATPTPLATFTLVPPTLTPTAVATSTPKADVIFFNGQVVTMDADMTQTEALSVKDGRIQAVGNSSVLLAMADSDTRIIDLNGRTLIPGFVDSHTHIFNDRSRVGLNQRIPNGTLEEAQDLAIELGITTLADMWVDSPFLEQFQVFEPNLRVRTKLYLVYNSNCGDLYGAWWTSELPLTSASGKLQVTPGIKMFSDGGSCGNPAMTVELEPDYYGDLFMTENQLVNAIADMDRQGLQVAIHATGDRAIETVLDAYETVLAGRPNTLRHRIEHNSYLRPDLLPRYGQIGLVPSVSNSVACWMNDVTYVGPGGELILTQWGGPMTHSWMLPWRSLIDQNPGIKVAWQSDTPWVGFGPITDLYSLVTRNEVKVYEYYGLGLGPLGTVCNAPDWLADEALIREEALQLMTINSAYALHMDDVVGSLEPGKYADLVVLSDNPLTVNEQELKDLEVLVTIIGGVVEYCAPGNDSICPNSSP